MIKVDSFHSIFRQEHRIPVIPVNSFSIPLASTDCRVYLDRPMRRLDRYILSELLITLVYCLGGFLTFWISTDLFSELDEFQEKKLGLLDLIEYYFYAVPQFLVIVMPIALLLAILYTLSTHSRYNELTAIRCAGVSLWRLCTPHLLIGALFSIILFGINEFWTPISEEKTFEILHRNVSMEDYETKRGHLLRNINFSNSKEKRHWRFEQFDFAENRTSNPITVTWEKKDGTNEKIVAAGGVRWKNGIWTFLDVQTFRDETPNIEDDPKRTSRAELEYDQFEETPEQIKAFHEFELLSNSRAAKGANISLKKIFQIRKFMDSFDQARIDKINTQFQARLAEPWTCLVVVLIAIPFGAPIGRRNALVAVSGGIFICFGFFVLQRLGLALGTAGYIPAWLAAWFPNLLFGISGILLTTRIQ